MLGNKFGSFLGNYVRTSGHPADERLMNEEKFTTPDIYVVGNTH
jgi:hypothetical protein